MTIGRRARGLFGTTVTWGAAGALLGGVLCVVRYRPWPLSAIHWDRLLVNFAAFMGAGALWGAVCGLAFGLAVWRFGRDWSLPRVSARRVAWLGALAGAAFPVLLYTPVILVRGAYDAIPFYGMLATLSALAGAGCARAVFAVARRAPDAKREPASLPVASVGIASAFATRDRDSM